MQSATGKVVNGQIVVDGDASLPEGARVWVEVITDDDVQLTPEEQAELAESDAEISRGEFVTADEFFGRVRK